MSMTRSGGGAELARDLDHQVRAARDRPQAVAAASRSSASASEVGDTTGGSAGRASGLLSCLAVAAMAIASMILV